MKHNYEERRQNRIDYARAQAEKNQEVSFSLIRRSSEMASVIPFGQPILVGHHTEKRDRNYRAQIDNTMRKSVEAEKKAEYYADKADSIESNTAISSDDPEALAKLKTKLERLQAKQEFMKATNKCIKKKDKESFLKLQGASEALWVELTKGPSVWDIGFAHYQLTNNNAVINNTKKRIASLEKLAVLTTKETTIKGVRIVENVEANRVQLFFDGKPSDEVRKNLKSYGFKWCRSEGAWQRQLNNNAIWSAKTILERL